MNKLIELLTDSDSGYSLDYDEYLARSENEVKGTVYDFDIVSSYDDTYRVSVFHNNTNGISVVSCYQIIGNSWINLLDGMSEDFKQILTDWSNDIIASIN